MNKMFSKFIRFNRKSVEVIGCIDNYNDGYLTGWACTPDFNPVDVFLYVDNNFITSSLAELYRDDLKSENIGSGKHGFSFPISKEFVDDKKHEIKIVSKVNDLRCDEWVKSILIKSNTDKVEKSTIAKIKKVSKKSEVFGEVDTFSGNQVTGWLGSKDGDVYPYITANGKPCEITEYGFSRNDVHKSMGLPEKIGFVAKLPSIEFSKIEFKLHSISMTGLRYVKRKTILGGRLIPNSIATVFEALEISRLDNSVGIVVWEGTHNPIGRAQVLFNVIKEHRPTIIIAFDIGFSTEPVWQPLENSDCKALIIPWKDRELYANLFKSIGLNFDLIWICKPRYPAFVLAESLSHADTRYILDLDDNEVEMSSSKPSRDKPYGLLSAKMAQRYIDKVSVRSVASKTLQDDFGGLLLRHARKKNLVKRTRNMDVTNEIRVGFLGTIRPHKGVVEAAKAIKALNARKNYKIKFVVGGIYVPSSIRSELIKLNCEVHGKIDSARLNGHLQNLDLIITGFPDDNANKEILKYQITSKIGDALSNERPVLVPEGASVSDLAKTEGIYLFNAINFERILEKAIRNKKLITLDKQFQLNVNYKKFLQLEKQADKLSPRGEELFRILPSESKSTKDIKQNVILVWKQHDTGLYGRRVDHLARSCVASGMSVTCLELISEQQFAHYEKESVRIDSDFSYIVDDLRRKKDGFKEKGIIYKTISIDYTQNVESGINRYLINNELYPNNSVVVLFPAVPEWKTVVKCFTNYNIICDVVDNQLAWEKKRPLELLSQYKHIMDISSCVVFNSEDNRTFFAEAGYLKGLDVKVIPNWYMLPLSYEKMKQSKRTIVAGIKKPIQIVYSGNMNDRFDWDTVARLTKEINVPIEINLIGNCQRAMDKMTYILNDPSIIYHGPMRELELLELMKNCDLAIMPHIHDKHSGFMNPMKINMYREIGLPCVASSMPGVDFTCPNVFEALDSDDFLNKVELFIRKKTSEVGISDSEVGISDSEGGGQYINILKDVVLST